MNREEANRLADKILKDMFTEKAPHFVCLVCGADNEMDPHDCPEDAPWRCDIVEAT